MKFADFIKKYGEKRNLDENMLANTAPSGKGTDSWQSIEIQAGPQTQQQQQQEGALDENGNPR